MQQNYPDLSKIFAARSQRRLELAALSWEEKVAILELMRKSLPKNMWRNKSAREVAPGMEGAVFEVGSDQQ